MRVLVVSFSQSGQLDAILDNFLQAFSRCEIDRVKVSMKVPFPFPWTMKSFFEVMPESVIEAPAEIVPIVFKHDHYDLVVFGYQPWFLSPSIPATSILADEEFRKKLANVPVVTVIGARNMWISAQESVKRRIAEAGGILAGNLPFQDRAPNVASAFSIVHWMMSGKKTRKWGIFPRPGISENDISGALDYGALVALRLEKRNLGGLQDELIRRGMVNLSSYLMFIEIKARKIFGIWAKNIAKQEIGSKARSRLIYLFRIYLLVALFVISPFVFILFHIAIKPLMARTLARQKSYYLAAEML